jgi:hypothetical protein
MEKRAKNTYSKYFIHKLKVSYSLSKFIVIPLAIIFLIIGTIFYFKGSIENALSLLILGIILLIIGVINYLFIPRYIKRFEKKLKNK